MASNQLPEVGILVEAEAFSNYGGWVLDSQFDIQMGSPYLLSHGNGRPVQDATTTIEVHAAGSYNVWIRTKDWVPGYHPGRFTLAVNGTELGVGFGSNDQDWNWQSGGSIELSAGETSLALHDLTGFDGRCDAIFFGRDNTAPPEGADQIARSWRRKLRGLPAEAQNAGHFDVIVVGGGVPGAVAALVAARLGDRVALVQDRPYLGGNASMEIGLNPRGITGPVVDEVGQREPNGDLAARKLLDMESNATLFMEYTVYDVHTEGSSIVSIDAREARSGKEMRLTAPVFIDCSGVATLGLYAGAETLWGQESREEFNESLAPEQGNEMHHGNTVFFRTRMADAPVSFPEVPWALEVAKDFADLRGQLRKPGIDNGPGPLVQWNKDAPSDPSQITMDPRSRMKGPLTHFWEYGQWLDPYARAEHIRDHLLRAVYGTFSNVKTMEPDTYANLEFDWVAHVAASGEHRRYKGDYILTENDIREHKHFDDAVVQNDGAFCLHYPGDEKYDFRLKYWEWDTRDDRPYDIPFRSLYSVNVSNLLMAGKHMSATHVAGSNTKFMGNGGQHAIATAAAAYLCKKYNTTPRGIYNKHIRELQAICTRFTGTTCDSAKAVVGSHQPQQDSGQSLEA